MPAVDEVDEDVKVVEDCTGTGSPNMSNSTPEEVGGGGVSGGGGGGGRLCLAERVVVVVGRVVEAVVEVVEVVEVVGFVSGAFISVLKSESTCCLSALSFSSCVTG